jgi:hypothetical protein
VCCLLAGLKVVKSARTILTGGKSSSSSSSSKHEWVPLLSEARAALLSVLLHDSQPDLQQGVMATAAVMAEAAAQARSKQGHLQQQQQDTTEQQQAAGKKKKGSAAGNSSRGRQGSSADSSSSSADYTPLLELPVLNGWLAAVLDLLQQQEAEGRLDAAAASTAGHAAASLVGQLMGQQMPLLAAKSTTSSSSGGDAVLPALVVPDAASYAMLVRLFGAAGQYDRVAGLVAAALRGQLPLASTTGSSSSAAGSWPAGALQGVLAAAVGVWASAGRPGLALAMLDGLPAAGLARLDCPQLAAALLALVDAQVGLQHCNSFSCQWMHQRRLVIMSIINSVCSLSQQCSGSADMIHTCNTTLHAACGNSTQPPMPAWLHLAA